MRDKQCAFVQGAHLSFAQAAPQLVSVAPKLRESKFPVQVIWGESDTAFNMTASLDCLRGNLGNLHRIVTVPRARLFWPEEHPRLLTVMLQEFWSAADRRQ
jgi:pimeloyl-ACP methyl ester carboxylesterase